MSKESIRSYRRDAVFFEGLALGMPVHAAAKRAGYAHRTVYKYKKEDPQFAEDWEEAVEKRIQDLEREADRRAAEGVRKPVFKQGVQALVPVLDEEGRQVLDEEGRPRYELAFQREYSDTLLMFRLKALRPDVYRERHELAGNPDRPLNVTIKQYSKPEEGNG